MMDRAVWIEQVAIALEELGDRQFQQRVWWRGEGPEVSSFTEAVCTLDDKDLEGLIDRCGEWGYAADLADRLRRYDRALEEFIHDVGSYPPRELVLSDPRWPGLCDDAKVLADELRAGNSRAE